MEVVHGGLSLSEVRLERRIVIAIVFTVILISAIVAAYFYQVKVLVVKKNVIGIISIEGPIIYSYTAKTYINIIHEALTNESIKAVVLEVNSPGGYADLVERIYLDLLELSKAKPLVASVTMALSGGYYIAIAADYIYSHPTSMVGNVGVIGIGPPTLIPSERILETGPYKVIGFSKLLFPHNLSRALDNFVSSVIQRRGERLKLSLAELRRGLIYLGSEAVKVGLVDEIGSLQKAIEKAAKEAGLVEYEVVYLKPKKSTYTSWGYGWQGGWENLTVEFLTKLYPPPSLYYIYIPPEMYMQEPTKQYTVSSTATTFGSSGKGVALVDKTHGNIVSSWELNILIAELAKRNITALFIYTWRELDLALNNASCLIIASPTIPYSKDEVDRIEEFVNNGGILLLFYDPASEYVRVPELFNPINTVSTRFGLTFAKGYLYNEEEHYGIYRNIYVREFINTALTKNVTSLLLFTTTHIYSSNKGVALTSDTTYSSASEKQGKYAVIAMVENKGTVIAFADITFLMEPYCYLEDNYQLIANLVSVVENQGK